MALVSVRPARPGGTRIGHSRVGSKVYKEGKGGPGPETYEGDGLVSKWSLSGGRDGTPTRDNPHPSQNLPGETVEVSEVAPGSVVGEGRSVENEGDDRRRVSKRCPDDLTRKIVFLVWYGGD